MSPIDSRALLQTLLTTKINFEKLLAQQVFTLILSILSSFCICCAIYKIYTFFCLSGYFIGFTQFGNSSHCFNSDKFRDTAPKKVNISLDNLYENIGVQKLRADSVMMVLFF